MQMALFRKRSGPMAAEGLRRARFRELADVIFAWYTEVRAVSCSRAAANESVGNTHGRRLAAANISPRFPALLHRPPSPPLSSSGLFGILAARCPLPKRRTRNGAREPLFLSRQLAVANEAKAAKENADSRESVRAKIVGRALAMVPLRVHADSRRGKDLGEHACRVSPGAMIISSSGVYESTYLK